MFSGALVDLETVIDLGLVQEEVKRTANRWPDDK
jgi:hypothetical protein